MSSVPAVSSFVDVTPHARKLAEQVGARMGVSPKLHEQDFLLRFILRRHGPERGVNAYFTGAKRDADKLAAVIRELPLTGSLRILEFASGYGRITRFLKLFLNEHSLTASDIHPEACTFVSENLGIKALLSSQTPEKLNVGEDYDVIAAVSLFSHLPHSTFARWLGGLYQRVRPGGFMMLTTHGEAAVRQRPVPFKRAFNPELGYGYMTISDQGDLSDDIYGTMIVSPRYVIQALSNAAPTAELYSFKSSDWGIQDEWVLRRPS